jgi:hypothetical protein
MIPEAEIRRAAARMADLRAFHPKLVAVPPSHPALAEDCTPHGTPQRVQKRTDAGTVIEADRTYKPLAVNSLAGPLRATPALSGSALFVRTGTHLYRIQQGP